MGGSLVGKVIVLKASGPGLKEAAEIRVKGSDNRFQHGFYHVLAM